MLAQGAARVGAHYERRPRARDQAQGISAYDPRVIEVTGISMMLTAQGADHTAGNLPVFDCKGKTTEELVGGEPGRRRSRAPPPIRSGCASSGAR